MSYAVAEFEKDDKLGLLIPPEPIGKYHYFDYWLDDYDNTYNLAKDLGLKMVPKREEAPIAIGTAFWARTDALSKLFDYKWTYESFQDEPLPSDGTISHAVERILPFVAEDARYIAKIAMNEEYACKLLSEKKDELERATKILENEFGVLTPRQLNEFDYTVENIRKLRDKCEKLYIYGTGMFGKACARALDNLGIAFEGFVETKKSKDNYLGYNVQGIDDVNGEAGIIVAVSELFSEEIIEELAARNKNRYVIF